MSIGRSGWFKESHRHYLAAKGIKTNKYMARGGAAERRKKFLNMPTGSIPSDSFVPRTQAPPPSKGGVEKKLSSFALLEMKKQIANEGVRAGLTRLEAEREAQEWYEKTRAEYATSERLAKEAADIRSTTPTRQMVNIEIARLADELEVAVDSGDEVLQSQLIDQIKGALEEKKNVRALRGEAREDLEESMRLKSKIQDILDSAGSPRIGRSRQLGSFQTRRLNTLEADYDDAMRVGDFERAGKIQAQIDSLTTSKGGRGELRVPSSSPLREKALERLDRESESTLDYDERSRAARIVEKSSDQIEAEKQVLAAKFLKDRTDALVEAGQIPKSALISMFNSEDPNTKARAERYLTSIEGKATKEMLAKFERKGVEYDPENKEFISSTRVLASSTAAPVVKSEWDNVLEKSGLSLADRRMVARAVQKSKADEPEEPQGGEGEQ